MLPVQIAPRTLRINPGVLLPTVRSETRKAAEIEHAAPVRGSSQAELDPRVLAALNAAVAGVGAFRRWKRLFRVEISIARKQERLRMAHSQDWSQLGKHVRGSIAITCQEAVLEMAGLLAGLSIPGGRRLVERAVAAILQLSSVKAAPRS